MYKFTIKRRVGFYSSSAIALIIILLALGSYASKKATIEKDLDNELLLESKKIVASISSHGSEVVIYLNLIINDFK
jgi:hypothetical protein|tara:strand:- start:554 stop:781 length:228 start_codon:yes stop_codon:yes gene_type:complete